MNKSMTLYIPDNKQGTLSDSISLYEYKMARRFGGATVTFGEGLWINGEGEMEQEPVVMITSYFKDKGDLQIAADVLASQFIHDLKRQGEEAVMIVRNGEAIIA